MPSVSKDQFELMQAVANDEDVAKQRNIKQKMAREWVYKDMAAVITDTDHGELIGVDRDTAIKYLNDHEPPSDD